MRPTKLERGDLWRALKGAARASSIVYLTTLPEDVSTQDSGEREDLADRLEAKVLTAPYLQFYGRVGMYDFLGVGSATVDALLDWFGETAEGRCGVASVGNDGLTSAEQLMIGTSEASRQNRNHFAFRLTNGWVRPARLVT